MSILKYAFTAIILLSSSFSFAQRLVCPTMYRCFVAGNIKSCVPEGGSTVFNDLTESGKIQAGYYILDSAKSQYDPEIFTPSKNVCIFVNKQQLVWRYLNATYSGQERMQAFFDDESNWRVYGEDAACISPGTSVKQNNCKFETSVIFHNKKHK